jgi:PPM family protein phosphatase
MRSRPIKKRKKSHLIGVERSRISCWSKSDVGLKRELNEDNFLDDPNLNLFIVADGMGGHAGGDTASRLAVEIVRQKILEARQVGNLFNARAAHQESPAILKLLQEAVRAASAQIFAESRQKRTLEGMGTTVTLVLAHGERAYVAHVGDSRLYRYQDGAFEQITEDHSLVNEQIKAGFITAEEALHSRFRNIITRSVGFESEVSPDTFSFPMKLQDVFVMCSDGLSGMVTDPELRRAIEAGPMSDLPSRLVAMANQRGGEDNITVIVLRYEGVSSPPLKGKSKGRHR